MMRSSTLFAVLALVFCDSTNAQPVLVTGAGEFRINSIPQPRTFTVGNNFTLTGSAFNIRGDWMTPTTGEVMRTLAPLGNNNYFRMYHGIGLNGGYTAITEAAEFYSLANSLAPTLHFHVNAPNGALRFQTNTLLRAQINPTQTAVINGFTVNTDGFLGLGRSGSIGNTAPLSPWTRLHMHDDVLGSAITPSGYRSFMRNGLTISGHGDAVYFGHKYGNLADATNTYIIWSDNDNTSQGPDEMRFAFTSSYNAANLTGPNSYGGREIMRMHPMGFVGVGDFYADSVINGSSDPTERVDLLDGKLRIRQLPNDPLSTSLEAVVVNTTTGVLEHRPFPAGTGGTDCDWEVLGSDVVTAYLPNGTAVAGCPEEDNSVIIGASPIGLPAVNAKLKVYAKPGGAGALYIHSPHFGSAVQVEAYPLSGPAVTQQAAISGFSKNASQINKGVAAAATIESGNSCSSYNAAVNAEAFVEGGAEINFGARSLATILTSGTSSSNYAVFGAGKVEDEGICASNSGTHGIASGPASVNFGAYGLAYDSPTLNYGVYGEANGPQGSINWGGYFKGNVHIVGDLTVTGTYPSSDAMLKTNVEEIPDALELIGLLRPKRYDFLVDQFPQLALPVGQHMGFVAQEVQEVLPNIVKEFKMSAVTSDDGTVTAEGFTYLGVNYTEVIPVLVAAVQELKSRNDALQAQVSACCAGFPLQRTVVDAPHTGMAIDLRTERLLIQPNPIADQTLVRYYIAKEGRARLEVSAEDGRLLDVLREERTTLGEHSYEWNTSGMAPGSYFVALSVDGNVIVKKVVKVGDR